MKSADNHPVSGADYLRQILRAPIYEVATVTPLQDMPRLTARIGNHVQIKREDRQPVHSFKLRGAYNMVSNLTEEQKRARRHCRISGKPCTRSCPFRY